MQSNASFRSRLTSDTGILVLVALAGVLLHTLTNGQYGFHRDELDTLDNARFLAWGYVAYPPLTPFVGRIGLELFGASLVGVRLFAALSQGAVILLAGLMARGLGGARPAQVVAALAVGITPMAMTSGLLLHYLSFDYLWWVMVATCLIYLLKTDNPRWWLGVGLGIGLGMMTKYTMIVMAAGVVVGVLLTRARRYLPNRWLWAGVALSLLIFLPNLIWQIQHDFVSLDFLGSIHARDIAWGRTANYLSDQLLNNVNPFMIPLAALGLYFYFFAAAGKTFRLLGWVFVTAFLAFLIMRGRAYYAGPAYPMLLAGGAVWGEVWLRTRSPGVRRLGGVLVGGLILIGGAAVIPFTLPVTPIKSSLWTSADRMNQVFSEMIGWPELVETVADIYRELPAEEQPNAAILTGNYGQTGAINLYGPAYGLPKAISGADSAWYRGYGDLPPETVILVTNSSDPITGAFRSCRRVAQPENPYNVRNEESTNTVIRLCKDMRLPWPTFWEKVQTFQ
jgi:4-amino-4-deoxy-L-arabinose transferase-like glycosyltransferase